MKKTITFIFFAVLLAAGYYTYTLYTQSQSNQAALDSLETVEVQLGTLSAMISATGTARSNQSAWLTWDTSGSVAQVDAFLGMPAAKGDGLAALEQTSLSQSVILAQADLVSARQSLDDLYDTNLQQAQALQSMEDAQQSLDDLFNPELQQAQALQAIADAEKALDDAGRNLGYLQSSASQANIDAQKAQVILAEDALDRAKEKYEPYANKPEDNLTRANLLAKLSATQAEYDKAVRNLNGMLADTADPVDLAVAEADISTAQAQLLQSQRDYERVKDGPTEAEIALAEAKLLDARQNLADLEDGPNPDEIAAAEARIAAAEATLKQVAITAPFDGQITAVKVLPGDQVSPGTPAFRLDDLSRLLVDVEISEADITQIEVGQPVVITFDAIRGSEYHGEVIEVALVGDNEGGVVSFDVVVALTDPDEDVRPGMTADVEITTASQEGVLIVPLRSIQIEGEHAYVQRLTGDQIERIAVELGMTTETEVEITGDVDEGDVIVTVPSAQGSAGGGMFGGMFGGGE